MNPRRIMPSTPPCSTPCTRCTCHTQASPHCHIERPRAPATPATHLEDFRRFRRPQRRLDHVAALEPAIRRARRVAAVGHERARASQRRERGLCGGGGVVRGSHDDVGGGVVLGDLRIGGGNANLGRMGAWAEA